MNKKIQTISFTAIFAALIFVITYFTKIPFPIVGYGHLGDSFIYLAAAFLPLPYAMGASAIGAGFSDYLAGYAIYVPFTIVIKALMAFAFYKLYSHKKDKLFTVFAVLAAGIVNILGYFIADLVIYQFSPATAIADAPLNIGQSIASSIVFIIMLPILNKILKSTHIFEN